MEQGSDATSISSSSGNLHLGTSVNDDAMSLSAVSVKEFFSCPYSSCNFSTAWKSSLNMHMKTHTDERPWECALCNKHFKLKHHLKHHILTHSQHKLLKCNLCEYRCNDSHSLQRHKVNRHRFPQKRSIKKNSLPTMVSLPSVEELSCNSDFFNNLLEQQRSRAAEKSTSNSAQIMSEPLSSMAGTLALASDGNLSSASQMLLQQQNMQGSSPLKLRNFRSVSDSFSPSFGQRKLSSENESIIDLSEDFHDKSVSKQRSVSPPESIPMTVKEETSCDPESSESSSLQKTPNSQTSYDYLHGNRSTVGPTTPKSPTSIEKQFSSPTKLAHSPVFEDRHKSPIPTRLTERQDTTEPKITSTWTCAHCKIIFPNNIMYGLHMGCHSVGNPFQCNICGMKCKDSHDFMFHFTIGKHLS